MSTPKPKEGTGDLTTFNIHHGFAEALVRGMRSSFLQDQDYHHLTQCETLDDVRLNLTETDYADSIADFNSLTPNTLQKAAVDKVRRFSCSLLFHFHLVGWASFPFCVAAVLLQRQFILALQPRAVQDFYELVDKR
jgi:ATP synthase (C/AC39) subunit